VSLEMQENVFLTIALLFQFPVTQCFQSRDGSQPFRVVAILDFKISDVGLCEKERLGLDKGTDSVECQD
jgi:hypothetical protein